MRYVKVLLLAILLFLTLVFLFQNQAVLTQDLTLTLNLFFIPPMASMPLPLYFIVIIAFFIGAILALSILVWDKISLSARLMKGKWRISSLEREVEKLKKASGAPSCTGKDTAKAAPGHGDVTAPDPDKG